MKICRDCKKEKEDHLFIKNKLAKSGIDSLCICCNRRRVKEWRFANPEKRKPTRKNMTKVYRDILIDFLIKRDGFICGICKESLEESKLHIDHIIPVSKGGLDTMGNIQLAHQSCNIKQGLELRKEIHGF